MMFDAREFISSQNWTFAKTRPRNPHEYIVRGRGNSHDDFEALLLHIFEKGIPRIWGGKIYICWYAGDGYRYWTMGWPIAEEQTINRAHDDFEQTTAVRPGRYYKWSSKDGQPPEGLRKAQPELIDQFEETIR